LASTADALGDTIAIMASGRLRAVGSSLFLKNRFGAGYSLNIIADPNRMVELREMVKTNLPGADIVFGGACLCCCSRGLSNVL
jgi:ATP-binding cassette subfamily A (ABC1) protein 3